MLRSIPFHLNINLSKSFSIFTNRNGRALETVCQHSRDVNAYQHRIYKLDFCSYNFHVFRLLRSGKGDVDVYRFISKHMVQITMCFVVMIPCHTLPSMCHHTCRRSTIYFLFPEKFYLLQRSCTVEPCFRFFNDSCNFKRFYWKAKSNPIFKEIKYSIK